ncbi:unnamed protein product [Pedinophyceae sp. YPF-701]|nr:unnamed protein product [Pedinophyceae sp. YPF-701]
MAQWQEPLAAPISLPPEVQGIVRGTLRLDLGPLAWKRSGQPERVAVGVKWWGEQGYGTVITVGTSTCESLAYKICCGPHNFARYLRDMQHLELHLTDAENGRPVGVVSVATSALDAHAPLRGAFTVHGAHGRPAGELHIALSMQYNSVVTSFEMNEHLVETDAMLPRAPAPQGPGTGAPAAATASFEDEPRFGSPRGSAPAWTAVVSQDVPLEHARSAAEAPATPERPVTRAEHKLMSPLSPHIRVSTEVERAIEDHTAHLSPGAAVVIALAEVIARERDQVEALCREMAFERSRSRQAAAAIALRDVPRLVKRLLPRPPSKEQLAFLSAMIAAGVGGNADPATPLSFDRLASEAAAAAAACRAAAQGPGSTAAAEGAAGIVLALQSSGLQLQNLFRERAWNRGGEIDLLDALGVARAAAPAATGDEVRHLGAILEARLHREPARGHTVSLEWLRAALKAAIEPLSLAEYAPAHEAEEVVAEGVSAVEEGGSLEEGAMPGAGRRGQLSAATRRRIEARERAEREAAERDGAPHTPPRDHPRDTTTAHVHAPEPEPEREPQAQPAAAPREASSSRRAMTAGKDPAPAQLAGDPQRAQPSAAAPAPRPGPDSHLPAAPVAAAPRAPEPAAPRSPEPTASAPTVREPATPPSPPPAPGPGGPLGDILQRAEALRRAMDRTLGAQSQQKDPGEVYLMSHARVGGGPPGRAAAAQPEAAGAEAAEPEASLASVGVSTSRSDSHDRSDDSMLSASALAEEAILEELFFYSGRKAGKRAMRAAEKDASPAKHARRSPATRAPVAHDSHPAAKAEGAAVTGAGSPSKQAAPAPAAKPAGAIVPVGAPLQPVPGVHLRARVSLKAAAPLERVGDGLDSCTYAVVKGFRCARALVEVPLDASAAARVAEVGGAVANEDAAAPGESTGALPVAMLDALLSDAALDGGSVAVVELWRRTWSAGGGDEEVKLLGLGRVAVPATPVLRDAASRLARAAQGPGDAVPADGAQIFAGSVAMRNPVTGADVGALELELAVEKVPETQAETASVDSQDDDEDKEPEGTRHVFEVTLEGLQRLPDATEYRRTGGAVPVGRYVRYKFPGEPDPLYTRAVAPAPTMEIGATARHSIVLPAGDRDLAAHLAPLGGAAGKGAPPQSADLFFEVWTKWEGRKDTRLAWASLPIADAVDLASGAADAAPRARAFALSLTPCRGTPESGILARRAQAPMLRTAIAYQQWPVASLAQAVAERPRAPPAVAVSVPSEPRVRTQPAEAAPAPAPAMEAPRVQATIRAAIVRACGLQAAVRAAEQWLGSGATRALGRASHLGPHSFARLSIFPDDPTLDLRLPPIRTPFQAQSFTPTYDFERECPISIDADAARALAAGSLRVELWHHCPRSARPAADENSAAAPREVFLGAGSATLLPLLMDAGRILAWVPLRSRRGDPVGAVQVHVELAVLGGLPSATSSLLDVVAPLLPPPSRALLPVGRADLPIGRLVRLHVFTEQLALPLNSDLTVERPRAATYHAEWTMPGSGALEATAQRGPVAPAASGQQWKVPLRHTATERAILDNRLYHVLLSQPLVVAFFRHDPPRAPGLEAPPAVGVGFVEVPLLPLLTQHAHDVALTSGRGRWLAGSYLLVDPAAKNLGAARVRIKVLLEMPRGAGEDAEGAVAEEDATRAAADRVAAGHGDDDGVGGEGPGSPRSSWGSDVSVELGEAGALAALRGQDLGGTPPQTPPRKTVVRAPAARVVEAKPAAAPAEKTASALPEFLDMSSAAPKDAPAAPATPPRRDDPPPPAETPQKTHLPPDAGSTTPQKALVVVPDAGVPVVPAGELDRVVVSVRVDEVANIPADSGARPSSFYVTCTSLAEPASSGDAAAEAAPPAHAVPLQPSSQGGSFNALLSHSCTVELAWDLTRPATTLADPPGVLIKAWTVHADDKRPELLGCAIVDASLLAMGVPEVAGWYTIVSHLQRQRGQIKAAVAPIAPRPLRVKRELPPFPPVASAMFYPEPSAVAWPALPSPKDVAPAQDTALALRRSGDGHTLHVLSPVTGVDLHLADSPAKLLAPAAHATSSFGDLQDALVELERMVGALAAGKHPQPDRTVGGESPRRSSSPVGDALPAQMHSPPRSPRSPRGAQSPHRAVPADVINVVRPGSPHSPRRRFRAPAPLTLGLESASAPPEGVPLRIEVGRNVSTVSDSSWLSDELGRAVADGIGTLATSTEPSGAERAEAARGASRSGHSDALAVAEMGTPTGDEKLIHMAQEFLDRVESAGELSATGSGLLPDEHAQEKFSEWLSHGSQRGSAQEGAQQQRRPQQSQDVAAAPAGADEGHGAPKQTEQDVAGPSEPAAATKAPQAAPSTSAAAGGAPAEEADPGVRRSIKFPKYDFAAYLAGAEGRGDGDESPPRGPRLVSGTGMRYEVP